MKIELPDNINLDYLDKYILSILIDKQYSFSLYNKETQSVDFYYTLKSNKNNAFTDFQDLMFENEFFTSTFGKVYIINYSDRYTHIPEILFDEKDKESFMNFLFSDKLEKILSNTVNETGIVTLHSINENIYDFFHRSFVDFELTHYTVPIISYLQNIESSNSKQMFFNKSNTRLDVYCFFHNKLQLVNSFDCNSNNEAVYYLLLIWKQLKLDQMNDFLYSLSYNEEILEILKTYINKVETLEYHNDIDKNVPFEIQILWNT
ncbi:hypothetical protein M2138_000853 [Dysgonomonadaceae bacterium PH5-43]|nr:hypothetical protein [Dysgonomonadaceae bacterium PH5-43]